MTAGTAVFHEAEKESAWANERGPTVFFRILLLCNASSAQNALRLTKQAFERDGTDPVRTSACDVCRRDCDNAPDRHERYRADHCADIP